MHLSEILPDRMALLTTTYWRERNRLGVPVPLFEPLSQDQATRIQEQERYGNSTTAGTNSQDTMNQPGVDGKTANASSGTQNGDTSVTQNSVLSQTTSASASRIGQVGPAVGGVTSASTNTANTPVDISTAAGASAAINHIQIPAPQINWSYAVIERLDPNTLKNSLVPFNLGRLVQDHDPSQDLELQPGDIVTILSQKDVPVSLDAQTKYIRLEGEFVAPGVYSSEPGETLADLIRKAGGFTPKAYLYGSSFLRESARVFQQQRLDDYITQLSADMDRALAVHSVSSSVTDLSSGSNERNVIAQLRQMRATGRIVLAFGPHSQGLNAVPAIQLENGDVFRVPSTPATVSVIGAVHGQNVFLYEPKFKVDDYLSLAGDTNRVADKKEAFIIRADGSILSREHLNSIFTNHFETTKLYPGDSIVIPEKLIRPTVLRELVDYSQILSSFGLAAAAINVVH